MLENTNHFLDNYHNDTNNLTKHIASQLPKEIGNDDRFKENTLDFYTLLDSLRSHNTYYTYIDSKDIENLSINDLQDESKLGYLYCLYTCNPLLVLDNENNTTLNNKVITQNFGYKDDFYLSFIANKDSLSNEYLNARKALYKTYQQIKQEQTEELQRNQEELEQELQGLDSKARESKLQELQRKQERELREKQREKERQEQRQARFSKNLANTYNTSTTQNLNTNNNVYITQDSNLILESKDKSNVIIFLDSANSLSNLIHIHNERIDIFTKDYTRLDIQELESILKEYQQRYTESNNQESHIDFHQESKLTLDSLHSANTQIFLYSQLLLGSKEIESNPLFFGELDSKDNNLGLDTLKPIYHLIGETDYDTKDSKERFTQTLQVFLNSNTLTLLNYSLLDSSLNIKLECNSSESQAIQEREKAQRDKDSSPVASNDKSQSTALLHPILEDNEIKCPHNGVVKLKANKGKSFTSKGIPMVLESDLLNAPIIGCANPMQHKIIHHLGIT